MPQINSSPNSVGFYDDVAVAPVAELSSAVRLAEVDQRLRFSSQLEDVGQLDAAFIRRASDTLVVTFHGSLDRNKFTIPRFERARMTEAFNVSCLYWADPSLSLDAELPLAWYTGTQKQDLSRLFAKLSTEVAESIGARRIIFTGSSGGGFASLQVSAQVSGSTALVFNPQTAISGYWKPSQRQYLKVCAPDVLPVPADEFDFSYDWSESQDDRYSAVRRYSQPTANNVVYWTNINDWHHQKHFIPFKAVAETRAGGRTLTVREYDGPNGHNVPTPELFHEALAECLGN